MFKNLIARVFYRNHGNRLFIPIRGIRGEEEIDDTFGELLIDKLDVEESSPKGYTIRIPKGSEIRVERDTSFVFLDFPACTYLSVLPKGTWRTFPTVLFWHSRRPKGGFPSTENERKIQRLRRNYVRKT